MAKLIILRGNSGSGKTTVAKALQEKFGANTMLLSHDVIRREILKVKDGIGTPACTLLIHMLKYGRKNCEIVILEGILDSECYRELFKCAIEEYGSNIYAYYYDLPFEETLRYPHTRPFHLPIPCNPHQFARQAAHAVSPMRNEYAAPFAHC